MTAADDAGSVAERSTIADPGLAPEGHQAIAWAQRHAPVLGGMVRSTFEDGSLQGVRLAVVVHLEAKTALLATILADAGAEVVVAGSNPHSTRDEIAAALVERGIEVHSRRGSDYDRWEADLFAVADREPSYIIDDGAELTTRVARHRPLLFSRLRGVSEETTTGVGRLRALSQEGRLPFPAMAANDAACKQMFDNRYGTGQSTIQAVLSLTNMLLAGKRVVIIGYGWVGRGIATHARGIGARCVIVEVDPIKALEARMDGHDVAPITEALGLGDFVITATGGMRAVGSAHFPALRDNVVLANAGHHDLEIDVPALASEASNTTEMRPGVVRYELDDGRRVNVLASGALVNIAGGLGHPIEIMDLSFAVQGMSLHELVTGQYPPGVHVLPRHLDEAIARAKLDSDGIRLDAIGEDQRDNIGSWTGDAT
jgi:adenosylhomocysteinase